jgi:hypothetical protein
LCAGTGQIAGNLRQIPDRLAARCVKRTAGIERIGAGTTGTACTATAVAGRYTMDPGNDDLLSLYRTEILPRFDVRWQEIRTGWSSGAFTDFKPCRQYRRKTLLMH